MKQLKGTVNKIRFSTDISGGSKSTSTSYVAVFEIDGQPIELKMPSSIMIDNGHLVEVVGTEKRGVFTALAYRNFDNGVLGKGPAMTYIAIGSIFTLVGLCTIPVFFGLIFVPVGIYTFLQGRKISKAYQIVSGSP